MAEATPKDSDRRSASRKGRDRRRRRRDGNDIWPNPPRGKLAVLHTRVVTETGGGPDKTIFLSAPYMADTPYWLAAAYMHPPQDEGFEVVKARAKEIGCPMINVPDAGPLDRKVVRRLVNLCRRYNVKIWHGHDYKSNLLGLMLRPFYDLKLVTTVHGWVKHTSRTPLYYAVDRFSLPYYHHVICVSDDLLERCKKSGVPEGRLTHIPNAIDERTFSRSMPPAEAPLRKEHGTPAGRLVIGAVGRLSPEKAFNNLIKAADALIKEGNDIEVWIAGDGDAKPDLEKLITHLKLQDRVKLLGFQSDLVALYQAMDLFVLSSLREGLPNVVLEAASMKVPIVSTKVAGVPKMLTDNVDGLLCECGDVADLTRAMRIALSDENKRRQMAEAARKLIEKDYSFANRMAKVRAIYDNVLAGDAPEAPPSPAGTPTDPPQPGADPLGISG